MVIIVIFIYTGSHQSPRENARRHKRKELIPHQHASPTPPPPWYIPREYIYMCVCIRPGGYSFEFVCDIDDGLGQRERGCFGIIARRRRSRRTDNARMRSSENISGWPWFYNTL